MWLVLLVFAKSFEVFSGIALDNRLVKALVEKILGIKNEQQTFLKKTTVRLTSFKRIPIPKSIHGGAKCFPC